MVEKKKLKPDAPARLTPARQRDLVKIQRQVFLIDDMFVMNPVGEIRRKVIEAPGGTQEMWYTPMGVQEAVLLSILMSELQSGRVSYFKADKEWAKDEARIPAAWKAIGDRSYLLGGSVATIALSRRMLAASVYGRDVVGGKELDSVMESLRKLMTVQSEFVSRDKSREWSMRLIAQYSREGDNLIVILNPLMVRAICEAVPGFFSMLSLADLQLARSSKAAALLLLKISALIYPSGEVSLSEQKLLDMLWWDNEAEASQVRSLRYRRKALDDALAVIARTPDWSVQSSQGAQGNVIYTIKRISLVESVSIREGRLPGAGGRGQLDLL